MGSLAALVVWLDVQCSGVIAAPGLVLYAGHCSEDVHFVQLAGGEFVQPIRCAINPDTRHGYATDVGYCLLDRSVGETRLSVAEPVPGATVVGVGYGRPLGIEDNAHVLHGTFLDSYKHGALRVAVSPSDFCWGDSGGPLFDVGGNLIGIASAAIDGCNYVELGARIVYYTPALAVRSWLFQETGIELLARMH